jgi:predicted MFS family arabinose efflux permease
MSSACVFVTGGVLAARLGSMVPGRSGLVLGLYYGGAGTGIVLSALMLPWVMVLAANHGAAHAWQWAWLALALACLLALLCLAGPARQIPETSVRAAQNTEVRLRQFSFGLASYFMFGVGYIGYMTFVLALLKEQGIASETITVFYVVLGIAVMSSARLWSQMLDRFKGGESMLILNCLLGLAVLIPTFFLSLPWIFCSGILFGAVFLSVVASTTALVRHNLPEQAWARGISAFTIVFAMGQIVGPTVVGAVADQRGGLRHGLFFSAAALLLGALLAIGQKPLKR